MNVGKIFHKHFNVLFVVVVVVAASTGYIVKVFDLYNNRKFPLYVCFLPPKIVHTLDIKL
jgi:hypothetical protein